MVVDVGGVFLPVFPVLLHLLVPLLHFSGVHPLCQLRGAGLNIGQGQPYLPALPVGETSQGGLVGVVLFWGQLGAGEGAGVRYEVEFLLLTDFQLCPLRQDLREGDVREVPLRFIGQPTDVSSAELVSEGQDQGDHDQRCPCQKGQGFPQLRTDEPARGRDLPLDQPPTQTGKLHRPAKHREHIGDHDGGQQEVEQGQLILQDEAHGQHGGGGDQQTQQIPQQPAGPEQDGRCPQPLPPDELFHSPA